MQPNQDTGFFDDDNDLNYGQDQQETQRARDKQDEVTMDTTIGTQPVQLPTSAQLPVDVQNTNTANLPLHQDFNRPNDHGPVSRMEFNELREQGNAVVRQSKELEQEIMGLKEMIYSQMQTQQTQTPPNTQTQPPPQSYPQLPSPPKTLRQAYPESTALSHPKHVMIIQRGSHQWHALTQQQLQKQQNTPQQQQQQQHTVPSNVNNYSYTRVQVPVQPQQSIQWQPFELQQQFERQQQQQRPGPHYVTDGFQAPTQEEIAQARQQQQQRPQRNANDTQQTGVPTFVKTEDWSVEMWQNSLESTQAGKLPQELPQEPKQKVDHRWQEFAAQQQQQRQGQGQGQGEAQGHGQGQGQQQGQRQEQGQGQGQGQGQQQQQQQQQHQPHTQQYQVPQQREYAEMFQDNRIQKHSDMILPQVPPNSNKDYVVPNFEQQVWQPQNEVPVFTQHQRYEQGQGKGSNQFQGDESLGTIPKIEMRNVDQSESVDTGFMGVQIPLFSDSKQEEDVVMGSAPLG